MPGGGATTITTGPTPNTQHHHSGLSGYTPVQVLTSAYREVAVTKPAALDLRYVQNPERFVRGRPIVALPPKEVPINPISDEDIAEGVIDAVNFPTRRAAGYALIPLSPLSKVSI
jgi:putative transposase